MHQKPFSGINAFWPWPLDPENKRSHPRLMGNLCMKFHDFRCRGKTIMRHKPFSVITALWPWSLTFWPRNTSWTHGEFCMKFHDDKWKGKAIIRHKPFSVIKALWVCDLDLLTFGPLNQEGISSTHVDLCMQFQEGRCKGKAIMWQYPLWPWPLDPKINRAHT